MLSARILVEVFICWNSSKYSSASEFLSWSRVAILLESAFGATR